MNRADDDRIIWIAGPSQSGTTLLMSLMDGHPELLVYPDEPHFPRIFQRAPLYASGKQMFLDFLYGTNNPVHLARDVGFRTTNRKPPIVDESAEEWLNEIPRIVRAKTLYGVSAPSFDHVRFFSSYFASLLGNAVKAETVSPQTLIDWAYRAVEAGEAAVRCKSRPRGRIPAFKMPMRDVDRTKIEWFRAHYGGRIVFIRRNPYARLWSQIADRARRGRPERAPRLLCSSRGFVRLALFRALDEREAAWLVSQPGIVTVRYEALAMNPRGEMRRLCAELGLSFDEVVCEPTRLGYPVKNRTDHRRKGTGVSRESLNAYRRELSLGEKLIFGACLVAVRLLPRALTSRLWWSAREGDAARDIPVPELDTGEWVRLKMSTLEELQRLGGVGSWKCGAGEGDSTEFNIGGRA